SSAPTRTRIAHIEWARKRLKGEAQLLEGRLRNRGRRPRSQTMGCEHAIDVALFGAGLHPLHAPSAVGAFGDVYEEYFFEEPRPGVSLWFVGGVFEERDLLCVA